MRSGLIWALGVATWFVVSVGAAQSDGEDAAPWHVAKIAKLNRTRPQLEQAPPPADAQSKYLHIQLNFREKPDQARLHKFRVVTERGEQVGDLWGFNETASLLVFEGQWKSLAGLYLDGLGHREPLFAAPPAAPAKTTARVVVDAPATEAPRTIHESPAGAAAMKPSVDVRVGSAGDGKRLGVAIDAAPATGDPARIGVAVGAGAGSAMESGGGAKDGSGADDGIGTRRMQRGSNRTTYSRIGSSTSRLSLPLPLILYLSCGEDDGRGQIMQVDEEGRVLGIVSLPYLATGLAWHHGNALIAVTPRDGGHIYRIDAMGNVSVVRERDKHVPYPIDVGVGADSDTIVVADNVAHALFVTSTGGAKPDPYLQLKRPRRDNQRMSVAVTRDQHVLFGGNNDPGIFRFSRDEGSASRPPLLRGEGGVAADIDSLKWAATQEPNQICVFEGEQLLKRFLLLGNRRIYRQGLLSFAPAGALVVAASNADQAEGAPWFIVYQTEDKRDSAISDVRVLFKWQRARVVDFVVAPRMQWDRTLPSPRPSVIY